MRTRLKVRMRTGLKPLAAMMLLALQGCSMAPTYTVPSIDLPAHYREQTSDGPWHSAQPSDQLARRRPGATGRRRRCACARGVRCACAQGLNPSQR